MDDYFEKLKKLKGLYGEIYDEIIRKHPSPIGFLFHWDELLTPVELNIWRDIRFLGLPFYPQYPVDRYFVDFGDPVCRIGIEVDSKYHRIRGARSKDVKRESELRQLGWDIYRIEGRDSIVYEDDETGEISYPSILFLRQFVPLHFNVEKYSWDELY